MVTKFFNDVASKILVTFSGRNIYWHLIAITLTYILVTSGFDWWFFSATRGKVSNFLGISAGLIGFAIPVLLPTFLYIVGKIKGNKDLLSATRRAVQAGITAMIIIAAYKAITGRVQPEYLATIAGIDNSGEFNFGLFRYGIFWGWPSSHTAVAFAMSVCLALWYRHKILVVGFAYLYASFIALGAAMSFHWFSDVLAGIIIGSLIGVLFTREVYRNPLLTR